MDLDNTQSSTRDTRESSRASESIESMSMARETRPSWASTWGEREGSDERPMARQRGGEGRAGGIPLN